MEFMSVGNVQECVSDAIKEQAMNLQVYVKNAKLKESVQFVNRQKIKILLMQKQLLKMRMMKKIRVINLFY